MVPVPSVSAPKRRYCKRRTEKSEKNTGNLSRRRPGGKKTGQQAFIPVLFW